jgi:hypothetical protein
MVTTTMNEEVDNGTKMTMMSTTSGGEDNDVGRWATLCKRAAANNVNENYAAAGGTESVGGCVEPLSSSNGPPPFRCLPEEWGRRQ